MADTATPIGSMKDRQQLSSMGFLEHLEELRKRIIWSIVFIAGGFSVCYWWHEKIFSWMQSPIIFALTRHNQPTNLVYTNPTDPFNMYLKISLIVGIFVSSPFVLYQVWAFIAPGLYKEERRYVAPFMFSTVGLFVAGGFFAYKMVYPAALDFLIDYSKQFTPMITINEYTDLFMTIVLGLGVVFEMPILVFFLALFGIVSPGWMWHNLRYSILVIFVIAAIITPTTDIMNMCIFAAPMIVLYLVSIGVAFLVHPKQRKKRELNSR
ncbi:MAG TPA: twin-arginine translocase subunit TatC [Candidatus Saccharimonadales bacterium]|nr:twin-arginine translocase subunit TatC [Candidatus Saccharimonadales bacterium]